MSTTASASPVLTPLHTVPPSHAVVRSNELLSCARTALKIANSQQQNKDEGSSQLTPDQLHLFDAQHNAGKQASEILEDGIALLNTMDGELKHLEALVKRRGHTNDPTEEIGMSIKRLEADTKELSNLIVTMVPASFYGQRRKHWEKMQEWFQKMTQHQGERLKEILKVRAKVLEDQAQRRKQFQPKPPTSQLSQATSSSRTQINNPLFQLSPPPSKPKLEPPTSRASIPVDATGTASVSSQSRSTVSTEASRMYHATTSAPLPHGAGYTAYNNGYTSSGNSYGSYGYGGTTSVTGMRQRKAALGVSQDATQQQQQMQEQMLIRQQERQTQQRLQEAQHVESSLAELGTLFGKMSSLISQQAEVVDKLEDDVEAAMVDVSYGQQEITILYHLKKGNRMLIIKVFGLLIFFICFMRFYKK